MLILRTVRRSILPYMKKILIIDDDIELVKLYGIKFIAECFEVRGALDGAEGLALAKKECPDLILLDVNMPRMDGFAVMEKLRADKATEKTPIIIISNLDADDARMKNIVKSEPAYYLLKKNYTLADVVAKAKELLAG